MNWMTSAKKRMKKGRRSIDDALRLNNPYAKSSRSTASSVPVIPAHHNALSTWPSKRGMSKDEIMIANFTRTKHDQPNNSTPPLPFSNVDRTDPFDKLQLSPLSPPLQDRHANSPLISIRANSTKESRAADKLSIIGRKRSEREEVNAKAKDPIIFFNDGMAFGDGNSAITQGTDDGHMLEFNCQEDEDKDPLDLESFLPAEASNKQQHPVRNRENADTTIGAVQLDTTEFRKGDFHDLVAELSWFKK